MDVKFDQHFLKNEEVLKTIIINSKIQKKDIIYEIGPGQGALTKEILKYNPKQLISIEKDENMSQFLKEIKIQNNENFSYQINKDGVEEIDNYKFTKLIANIPYSITEPLYKKLMDSKTQFAILLHGNDFYKKIYLNNNKWHYFINAFYTTTILKEVPGTDFEPKTKTKSVLIKLELKQLSNLTQFEQFLQTLYTKKKRNTKNAIIYSIIDTLNSPKKEIKNKLTTFKFENSSTLENISNIEFSNLIDFIQSNFF